MAENTKNPSSVPGNNNTPDVAAAMASMLTVANGMEPAKEVSEKVVNPAAATTETVVAPTTNAASSAKPQTLSVEETLPSSSEAGTTVPVPAAPLTVATPPLTSTTTPVVTILPGSTTSHRVKATKGRFRVLQNDPIEETSVASAPPPATAAATPPMVQPHRLRERSTSTTSVTSQNSAPTCGAAPQGSGAPPLPASPAAAQPPVGKKKGRFVVLPAGDGDSFTREELVRQVSVQSVSTIPQADLQVPQMAQTAAMQPPAPRPSSADAAASSDWQQQLHPVQPPPQGVPPTHTSLPPPHVPTTANPPPQPLQVQGFEQPSSTMTPPPPQSYQQQQQRTLPPQGSVAAPQQQYPVAQSHLPQQQQQQVNPLQAAHYSQQQPLVYQQQQQPPQAQVVSQLPPPGQHESQQQAHPQQQQLPPTGPQEVTSADSTTAAPPAETSSRPPTTKSLNGKKAAQRPTHFAKSASANQGLGKVFYFLDQMKLEVTDADKTIKSLQKDIKFLREKNKELEAKSRTMEARWIDEKNARETAETKLKTLKKKFKGLKESQTATTAAAPADDKEGDAKSTSRPGSRANSLDADPAEGSMQAATTARSAGQPSEGFASDADSSIGQPAVHPETDLSATAAFAAADGSEAAAGSKTAKPSKMDQHHRSGSLDCLQDDSVPNLSPLRMKRGAKSMGEITIPKEGEFTPPAKPSGKGLGMQDRIEENLGPMSGTTVLKQPLQTLPSTGSLSVSSASANGADFDQLLRTEAAPVDFDPLRTGTAVTGMRKEPDSMRPTRGMVQQKGQSMPNVMMNPAGMTGPMVGMQNMNQQQPRMSYAPMPGGVMPQQQMHPYMMNQQQQPMVNPQGLGQFHPYQQQIHAPQQHLHNVPPPPSQSDPFAELASRHGQPQPSPLGTPQPTPQSTPNTTPQQQQRNNWAG